MKLDQEIQKRIILKKEKDETEYNKFAEFLKSIEKIVIDNVII